MGPGRISSNWDEVIAFWRACVLGVVGVSGFDLEFSLGELDGETPLKLPEVNKSRQTSKDTQRHCSCY